MTFQEMIDDVTRRMEETVGSPIHFTLAEIQSSINDGIEELSDATEFYERTFTLTCRPYATYYDLRTLVPSDPTILRVVSIWNPTRNQWLDPMTTQDLDYRTSRQWELVNGDPRMWFMRGMWWLGIFPTSTADPGPALGVQYRALHPRMTDPTEVPQQLPEDQHSCLVDYAMYDLLSKDAETQKAINYWNLYFEREKIVAARVGSRISRDRLPRMGIT
jgi:hypothetical protein